MFYAFAQAKVFVLESNVFVHCSKMEGNKWVVWASAGTSRPQMDDQASNASTYLEDSNPHHMEHHKYLEPTRILLLWLARSESVDRLFELQRCDEVLQAEREEQIEITKLLLPRSHLAQTYSLARRCGSRCRCMCRRQMRRLW